jgi:hypothetical protein
MTTPVDPGRETQIVLVRDRNVVIRQLIDTQRMLIARWAVMLQRDDVTGAQKLDLLNKMFNTLESVVVQQEDRDYLEELMAEGELDLRELISFITAFDKKADEPAKPKVRRGRAPTRR